VEAQAHARQRESRVVEESLGVRRSAEDSHTLGLRLYAEGRFAEALAALEAAASGTAELSSTLWNNLGAAAYACGEMEKSERGFRQALALNAEDHEAITNLGVLLANTERASAAR
jgi:Flp pilus assembly protein TadD